MPYQEERHTGSAPAGGAPVQVLDLNRLPLAVVTQITTIATAVTANGYAGRITTVSQTIAAAAEGIFTVNNDVVRAEDVVVVSVSNPGDGTIIGTVTAVADGSFEVTLTNIHASEAGDDILQVNFRVLPAPRL